MRKDRQFNLTESHLWRLGPELLNHAALTYSNRAAEAVGYRGLGRDTEGVVHGCRVIQWADGIAGGREAQRVAGPVDGASGDSSTGEKAAIAAGPVLAAGVAGGDLRFAAKFADPADECVAEHLPLFEIAEQGGQRLIGRRDQVILQAVEVVTVGVPKGLVIVVPVDADHRHAVFDETTGE